MRSRIKHKLTITLLVISSVVGSFVPAQADETAAALLITRPEGAVENSWLGALVDQYIRTRIALDAGLSVIDQQIIAKLVDGYSDYSKSVSKSQYTYGLSNQKFTHIVFQNYALSEDGSKVQIYIELDDFEKNEIVDVLDTEFPIHLLTTKLDSASLWLSKALGGDMSSIKQYMHINLIPSEVIPSDYQAMGQMIESSLKATEKKLMAKSGNAFLTVARQHSNTFIPNYLAGRFLTQAQSYGDAAETLERALSLIPGYRQLYPLACESFFGSGKYKRVIDVVESAQRYGMVDARMRAFEAQALEKTGKTEQAMKAYENVLKQDERSREGLIFFTRYYNDGDQLEKSASYARRVLEVDTSLGEAWFVVGRDLLRKGKKEEAIPALKKASKLLAGNHEPALMLGEIYTERKLYDTASKYLLVASERAPDDYEIAFKTASAYEQTGNIQKAYQVLSPFASKNPGNAELHLKLGLFAFHRKDSSAAFEHLKKYAMLEEKNGKALRILGDLYARYGNRDKANLYYGKALPLLDSPFEIMFSMASFYMGEQKIDSAIDFLEKIEKKKPDYTGLSRSLGDAWYSKKEMSKALEYYKKARKDDNHEKVIQERIAQITFDQGQKAQAAKEYARLTEMDKNNGQAWLRYALLLLELKRVEEGKRSLEHAMALITPDGQVLKSIAEAYRKAQAPEQAVEFYKKALTIDENNDSLILKLAESQLEAGQDSAAAHAWVSLYQRTGNDYYKDHLKKAGHLYFKREAFNDARETYLLFLGSNYTDNQVLLNLAEIEFERKKYKEVVKLLKKASVSSRRTQKYSRMYCVSLFETGDYKSAIDALAVALSKAPRDEELLLLMARSHVNEKEYSKAVGYYKKLIRKYGSKEKRKEYAYDLGQVYEKEGNLKNAGYWYRKNIEAYGGGLDNYLRLGYIYTEQKQLDEALAAYEKAAALADAPDSIILKVAQAYSAKKEYGAAAKYYRQYLQKAPRDSIAYLELGSVYIEKKEYPRALDPLKEAVRLMPSNSRAFYMMGGTHLRIGEKFKKTENVDNAVTFLSKAHELEPNRVQIIEELAKAYRLKNSNEQLIGILQKWHALDSKDTTVLLELGQLFAKGKQYNDAAEAWEKACKLVPKNLELRMRLSEVHGLRGDKKAQAAHLQAALEYDRKNSDIHASLARYYLGEKQLERAIEFYNNAITYKPSFAQARFELASILSRTGRQQDAFEQLRSAVKSNGENVEYLYALSKTAFEINKTSLALKTARKAISLRDNDAELMGWTGFLYLRTGSLDSAKQLLAAALKFDNSCLPCYRYLGDVTFAQKNYSDAIKIYERALQMGGHNETVSVMLGNSLLLSGDEKRALKQFESTFKLNPKNDEALFGLVRCYLREDKPRKALTELRVFQGDKKLSGYYQLSCAYLFEKAGNLDSALVSYTLATRLLPNHAEGYAGCGRVMLGKNKYNSAIVYFGKAMAHDPQNSEILLNMGLAYEFSKEYSSALSVYEEAIATNRHNVDSYFYMARLLSKRRKYSQAIEAVQAGLAVDQNSPRLYYALGKALSMSNRPKDAIGAYEMALKKGDSKKFLDVYRQIGLLYYHKLIDDKNAEKYFRRYLKKGGAEKDVEEFLIKIKNKN